MSVTTRSLLSRCVVSADRTPAVRSGVRVTVCLVLVVLLARPVSAGLPLDSIKDTKMRTTLRQVGLQVILGDSVRAMVNANSLGWEIFHKGRKGQYRELAFCLALQGLAELSLNLDREALWHWEAAQILLPELHADLMNSYSEIAKVLDSTPLRTHDSAVEWLRGEGKLAEGEGVTEPKIINMVSAVTPRRSPTALVNERVSVTYLVDMQGRVQAPKLVGEPPSDLAIFTVMQALMSWQYEPAKRNGELAWAVATSDFSFQRK